MDHGNGPPLVKNVTFFPSHVISSPVPSTVPRMMTRPLPEDSATVDAVALGRRVRHLRKQAGLTLDQLAERTGVSGSHLSLVENARREPRLSLVQRIAEVLGVAVEDLLTGRAPTRRAELEIEVERFARSEHYASLGLPPLRIGPRTPTEVLEVIAGLEAELRRRLEEQAATPEEARRANAQLRARMRAVDNHYPDLEAEAHRLLDAIGHTGGPLGLHAVSELAEHLGFTLRFVPDLPHSTRSVTDLKHGRIHISGSRSSDHDRRTVVLQALAAAVLGHGEPRDYEDFLAQRVAVNYLAGALLMPQRAASSLLRAAQKRRDLSVDDLKDAFGVSYEAAAHRFTNLATVDLGIRCHFQKVHETGVIHKAYENDGIVFPADHTGAIEGQQACRKWGARQAFSRNDRFRAHTQYTDSPNGTFWCTSMIENGPDGLFALSVGTPFEHARYFRGADTRHRVTSTCPDPRCCRRPDPELEAAWGGHVWPAARMHAHLLAAMPTQTFPGVDEREVFEFLQAQEEREG